MTEEEFADELEAEEQPAPPSPRTPASLKKKVVAGIMAVLLGVTFASSLLGGTRDTNGTSDGTTSSTRPPATTTTADRTALVDAGVALAAALAPVPAGDVTLAGIGGPTRASDQNTPDAALVDITGAGWYDASDGRRYAFVETRGGPASELAGCFQLAVTYVGDAGPAGEGEVNLGDGCDSFGASEKGRRLAGFLLPSRALWILELEVLEGAGPAAAGVVATNLFLGPDATYSDTTAVPLDAPPVAAELAEALLPLLSFRDAND